MFLIDENKVESNLDFRKIFRLNHKMLTSKRKTTQTKLIQNTNTDSNDSTNFIDQIKKENEDEDEDDDDEQSSLFTDENNDQVNEYVNEEQNNYDPTSSFWTSENNNSEANSNKKRKQSELEIKQFNDEKSHRINYTDGKARNKCNVKGQATGQKHRKGQVPIEYIENPLLRASNNHIFIN